MIRNNNLCFNCHKKGHRAVDCREKRETVNAIPRCHNCKRNGHDTNDCKWKKTNSYAAAMIDEGNYQNNEDIEECSSAFIYYENTEDSHINNYANEKHENYINTDLFNVITSACHDNTEKNMPVCNGKVDRHVVTVLRDTGCSGVVIKKEFVKENQYTGSYGNMIMIDKTVRRAPIAKIDIDTNYIGTYYEKGFSTHFHMLMYTNI